MIAVIFEVEPHPSNKQTYLDIAADLKLSLEQIEGFISVERFQSLTHPAKLLSLSFFQDEQAIYQWRNTQQHRDAQRIGRSETFQSYRIRVAHVVRDYGLLDRDEVPIDSQHAHDH